MDKNKIKKAPQEPGVYIFKDKSGRPIYIGKASNLRARLQSYLGRSWKAKMVSEATSLVWQITGSEIEALIEEANLIKKHKPRYNIAMRDDKNYLYVGFSKEKFQRIATTHQPINAGYEYIGPFTDAGAVKQILKYLRLSFPYCSCKRAHKKKCVNAQIGRCLGFCCMKIHTDARMDKKYKNSINTIKKILLGKKTDIIKGLRKKMQKSAGKKNYEEAAIYRNQISGIERIFAHKPYISKELSFEKLKGIKILANIMKLESLPERIEGYDISHTRGAQAVGSMVVFINGMPQKSEYRRFIIKGFNGIDDTRAVKEVLARRMRHDDWQKPDFVLIDGGKGQLNAAIEILSQFGFAINHIAALAKREEQLVKKDYPQIINLKSLSYPLMHLLVNIRDEAHRFAIALHRKKRRSARLE